VAAGVIAAGACLTRISSLSFVIPVLAWIALRELFTPQPAPDSRPSRLPARRAALIASGVCAVLIAPFLINCWRATGDPFFAINYHTRYYRAAEGLPPDESVGAVAYVGRKLRERPVATLDTAGVGLFVFPFTNKWSGFRAWSPALASMLRWLAVAGLVLALADPAGRLLWLLLVTSLVPYALTWPLGGGGEWRFTQHVYPLYLVAAGSAAVMAVRAIRRFATREIDWHAVLRGWRVRRAAAGAALLGIGWALYAILPYFVVREALAQGEPVSVGVSDRDFSFFSSKWSERAGTGNVMVRVAVADRVSMRLPLPRPVEHILTLRMDGPELADPSYLPKVTVFLDNRTVAQVRFKFDPTRMGAYRVSIPREMAGRTFSRLDLVASHTVRADQSGPRFGWLPGDTPVAFYLWYVRVEPLNP
jgi:hypothetical protein